MNNKVVGSIFCLISAILISAKYISAAMYMGSTTPKDAELFTLGLKYVGPFLTISSVIALLIGIAFFGYGIYEERK